MTSQHTLVVFTFALVACNSNNGNNPADASDANVLDVPRVDAAVIDVRVDAPVTDVRVDAPTTDVRVDVLVSDVRIDAPANDGTVDSQVLDTSTDVPPNDSTTNDTNVADGAVCTDFSEPSVVAGMPPAAGSCNVCRPASGTTAGTGLECASDSDCVSGRNGRCLAQRFGYACSYDQCLTHADCGNDQVCACGGDSIAANRCMSATCRSNEDCGGRACAPTFGGCGNYSGFVAYRCHTTQDECAADADCAAMGVGAYCAFDDAASHWVCSNLHCAG